jgi:hypothetical protein
MRNRKAKKMELHLNFRGDNFRLLACMSGDACCGKKSFPSKGLLFYDICNDIVRQSKFY